IGAMKRFKLKRLGPAISYEKLVEDLDPGDSSTTTLTELLVRHVKQATVRPYPTATAKGLRTLTAPQRVYRDRTGRGVAARPLNLADYVTVSPEGMDLDDDNNSLAAAVESISGAIEGAGVNSDLYDAYSSPGRRSSSFFPALFRCYP
ncbi:hypothetical protein BC826DRAFT_914246, partial [Russula brevipes]